MDNLPDGKYILHGTSNAFSFKMVKSGKGKPIIEEDRITTMIILQMYLFKRLETQYRRSNLIYRIFL
ncbi:MAG: hypothetical protein H0X03_06300 [Nitrosopumilus sp.]|nr:hypothetical protein [Nitrosopumilus sp.]